MAGDRRGRSAAQLLYSFRRSDAVLSARNGTTAALVAAKRLRAVPWGRRNRVLAADVERIATEGIAPDGRRPPSRRRKPTSTSVGDAIRAINIPERPTIHGKAQP